MGRSFKVHYILFLSLVIAGVTSCLTPSIKATTEQNKGDLLFNQHKYADAILHYEQMYEASKKLGIYRNYDSESDVLRKIANCYEMLGSYNEAMAHVNEAIIIDSTGKNLVNIIEDYSHQGKIYVYMGSYFRGITSLEKALSLSEKMDQSLKNTNRLPIADIYLTLSQLYAVMGKSVEALKYSDKAMSIFRQADEKRGQMESYLTLGTIFSDQGDIFTARKFIGNSLKIALDNGMGTARQYQLLASIESSAGAYENALRYQQMSLDEAKKTGIVAQIIWATVGMGDIYRDLGDEDQAEKYYRSAKEGRDTVSIKAGSLDASIGLRLGDAMSANRYFSSEGSLTGQAITSLRIAELLMNTGKTDSAVIMLDQAAEAFSKTGNLQGLSNTKLLMGKIFVDNGNNRRALSILDSALAITEFPETQWQAWYQKGRMYENLDQDKMAIESYRNSIAVIEKIRGNLTIDEFKSTFFDSKRDVYNRLINLLIDNNDPESAFQFSEQDRARAFYDILANKKIDFRGSTSGDLISLEQEKRLEMQKLYRLLQKTISTGTGSPGARDQEVIRLREALASDQADYEQILQKIKLNNTSYADVVAAEPVTLSQLISQLDNKTAILVYWISDENIIIWNISSAGISGKKVNIKSTEISSLIENTRRAIQSNLTDAANEGLGKLYSYLITPVGNNLKAFSNLVIIPNGALHFLPFQALRSPEGEYLVQNYNLVYAPSASVYKVCNDRPVIRGSRFLGLALADVSIEDKPGLPGTEDEVRKILPLFPDNVSAIGQQSTESFVKKNAGNCNFIHFATHGSYNYRQPLYSHLLLSPEEDDDGLLNVYEVLEMNINAKLVVLSACETGLGNISQGDELTGLSRAFLFAGSSSVIVSLWAVADYPTSFLMSTFYKYLKEHPVQEALTLAQRDVLKVYPQPLFWSPFILIGNGNIIAD
jgi:CHAT domain-containing protein/predicted negative regulator of RcsB-dependent stress response